MKYLDLAVKIAQGSMVPQDEKNYLLAAVAVRQDGAIVSATNVRVPVRTYAAHAESRVLRKAGYGATLWVARVDRRGHRLNAKPCARCQALIKNYGVKRCYFTIADNMYGIIKGD